MFDTSVAISNPGNRSHIEKRLKPIREDDEDYPDDILPRKNTGKFAPMKYKRSRSRGLSRDLSDS